MSSSEDRFAPVDTVAVPPAAPAGTNAATTAGGGPLTPTDRLIERLAQRPDIQNLRLSAVALSNLVDGLPPAWNIAWSQARRAAAERAAALKPACQAARTMQAHRAHEAEQAERKLHDMGQLARDAEQVAGERRAQAERIRQGALEALNAAAAAADEALARAVAAHNALEEAQQVEDTRLAQEQERIDFFLREAQDKVVKAQHTERAAQETLAVANREMTTLESDLVEQNQILRRVDREEQDALADLVIAQRTEHLRRIEEARAAARTRLAEQEERARLEALRLEALRKEGEQLEREIQMALEQDALMSPIAAVGHGTEVIGSTSRPEGLGLPDTSGPTAQAAAETGRSAAAGAGAPLMQLADLPDAAVAGGNASDSASDATRTGTPSIDTNAGAAAAPAAAATASAEAAGRDTPHVVAVDAIPDNTPESIVVPASAGDVPRPVVHDSVALTEDASAAVSDGTVAAVQVNADTLDAGDGQTSTPAETPQTPVAALRYQGRVRSGMEIQHEGDVVVEGQVHPGGLVSAGGDIHVYGTAAGRLVAGAQGDIHACIYVQSLEAEMVSIAGRYFMFEEILERWKDRPIRISLNAENRLSLEPIAAMPTAGGDARHAA